jgi:HEAT repeat protein
VALLALLSAPRGSSPQGYALDEDLFKSMRKTSAEVLASIGDRRALEALEAYLAHDRYNKNVSEALERMRSSLGQL